MRHRYVALDTNGSDPLERRWERRVCERCGHPRLWKEPWGQYVKRLEGRVMTAAKVHGHRFHFLKNFSGLWCERCGIVRTTREVVSGDVQDCHGDLEPASPASARSA